MTAASSDESDVLLAGFKCTALSIAEEDTILWVPTGNSQLGYSIITIYFNDLLLVPHTRLRIPMFQFTSTKLIKDKVSKKIGDKVVNIFRR